MKRSPDDGKTSNTKIFSYGIGCKSPPFPFGQLSLTLWPEQLIHSTTFNRESFSRTMGDRLLRTETQDLSIYIQDYKQIMISWNTLDALYVGNLSTSQVSIRCPKVRFGPFQIPFVWVPLDIIWVPSRIQSLDFW